MILRYAVLPALLHGKIKKNIGERLQYEFHSPSGRLKHANGPTKRF